MWPCEDKLALAETVPQLFTISSPRPPRFSSRSISPSCLPSLLHGSDKLGYPVFQVQLLPSEKEAWAEDPFLNLHSKMHILNYIVISQLTDNYSNEFATNVLC